jgi:anti-sigma regulatory factor (Ser/Thr protein kinase)
VRREHDELRLPADASAPRLARRHVVDVLTAWGLQRWCDDAVLLTSELVSNAVMHGRGEPCIVITRSGATLRISVHDDGGSTPASRRSEPDDVSGRGLAMVDGIASRWGSNAGAHGTEVWFELHVVAASNGTRA